MKGWEPLMNAHEFAYDAPQAMGILTRRHEGAKAGTSSSYLRGFVFTLERRAA